MQLTSDGVVEGIINVHGRTKAIYDENGEQIGGGDEIKSEGLVFDCPINILNYLFISQV